MKILNYKVLLILFITQVTFGQVILITDKSFYVTGEDIYFSLYLPAVGASQSIPIKLSLINNKNEIISTYFSNSISKSVNGHFFIPYDAQTDWFQILASNFDPILRKENILVQAPIPVYNDLDEATVFTINESIAESTSIPIDPTVFTLDKNIIKTREKIKGLIDLSSYLKSTESLTYAIRIIDKKLCQTGNSLPNLFIGIEDKSINYGSLFNYDFGVPAKSNNNQRDNITLYFKESNKYRYLSSITKRYTLTIDSTSHDQTIQAIYNTNFAFPVVLFPPLVNKVVKPIPYNETIKDYMQWSRIRKKTLSVFSSPIVNVTSPTKKIIKKDNDVKPNRSILVSKYDSFEDMQEFFREVTTPLKFKQDKSKKTIATIYHPDLNIDLEGTPMFMVNGILTDRADYIAKLQMRHVKKVDIFYDTRLLMNYFGMVGRHGFVQIETNNSFSLPDSIPVFQHQLNSIQSKPAEYRIPETKLSQFNSPIFQPLVYWNGLSTLSNTGKQNFEFTHSDDIGEFIIELFVISANQPLSIKQIPYTVKYKL